MSKPQYPQTPVRKLTGLAREIEILKRRASPAGLPAWVEIDPETVFYEEGGLDLTYSYIYAMVQGPVNVPTTLDQTIPAAATTVMLQMRLVEAGTGEPKLDHHSLPGLSAEGPAPFDGPQPIMVGWAFGSVDAVWDRPVYAYMTSDMHFIYPFNSTDLFIPGESTYAGGDARGDVVFAGGGVFPAEVLTATSGTDGVP